MSEQAKGLTGLPGDTRRFDQLQAGEKLAVSVTRWNELYAWLGEQAVASMEEARDNELCINLDESAGPQYHAEAMVEVRRHMRRVDSSLAKVPGIDSGLV